jgi:2-keto-3-deoxy-L-rhamnonate aldolase RhmA
VHSLLARIADRGVAVGTYLTVDDAELASVAAAGLDFVRLDPLHHRYADVRSLVDAIAAAGAIPWARVENDAGVLRAAIDAGAGVVTIADVADVDDAGRAAAVVGRERDRGVLLGGQIESIEGVDRCEEIVGSGLLDIVHTGRNDLSSSMGLAGMPWHDAVLDAEQRVVEVALAAGLLVSLHHPLDDRGVDRARWWSTRGVQVFSFDTDRRILARAFGKMAEAVAGLR